MKRTICLFALAGALVFSAPATSPVAAAKSKTDREKDLRKLPGYVDFGLLDAFKGHEPKVEVNLKGPLLQLASQFMDDEDEPELKQIMANIKSVRVFVYDTEGQFEKVAADIANRTSAALDSRGWERIVRVRDEGDNVTVHVKPSKGYEWIDGLVVMVIGDDDEAVFVNIAGKIHPKDVSKLSRHFDVDVGDIDLDH